MLPEIEEQVGVGRPLLGAAIRNRRIDLGITQSDLGLRCGISDAHVANIESGRRLPSLDALHALAWGLDTTARALLRDVYPWDGGNRS